MAAERLTDRRVRSVRPSPERRLQIFDADTTGLVLRVTERGHKSWYCTYRFAGKFRWLLLGHYPAISLTEARVKARAARSKVDDRRDPAAEHAAAARAAAGIKTFRELARTYIDEYARPRKRSWREDERLLFGSTHRKKTGKVRYVSLVERWGERPLTGVARQEIRALLAETSARAPIMANRMLACIRKAFNFALDRDWVESNPCAGIAAPAPERERTRVLTRQELRSLWDALGAENPIIADIFRLLLLTAQRSGEVLKMRWDELEGDETAGWWTLPPERMKAKRPHRVWLPEPAWKIIQARRVSGSECPFVFESPKRANQAIAHVSKAVIRLRKRAKTDFSPHDLRRTAASLMAAAGAGESVIPKILGHVPEGVTRRHYNLYAYDEEKRAALDEWSRELLRLVTQPPADRDEAAPESAFN